MNENLKLAIPAVAAVVVVGLAIKDNRKVVKTERAKRAAIAAESKKQLAAIADASQAIDTMIQEGEYDKNFSVQRVMDDFQFHIMAARFDKD